MAVAKIRKSRVAVLLPSKMRREMLESVLRDEYGMRGKSRWVAEAVADLLDRREWLLTAGAGEGLVPNPAHEVVYLEPALKGRIEDAVLEMRTRNPMMEGPQSAIIRAAITRRLLRSPN